MRVTPIVKDLVLVGGGHAHVSVIRSFAMHPMPGVQLTVISRDIETPYSGMLPGYIAGHYTREECHIDLRPLARWANARLIEDEVTGIDIVAKRILFRTRPPTAYDVTSIDIGSTPDMSGTPGAAQYATAVKPISRLAERWEQVISRAKVADAPTMFVVVGGGAAGVEMLLAAQHRLRQIRSKRGLDPDQCKFMLLTRGEVLTSLNRSAQAKVRRILRDRSIELHERCAIASVEAKRLLASDGRAFPFDELMWVTDARTAPWLRDTGLALDPQGFIAIDEDLRAANTPDVFAAGDCATSITDPRPKAGVFAVRQGPALTANLRHALAGEPLEPFKPQKQFLVLVSAGDKYAVAARGPFALEGRHIWRWKDHIDRTWMAKAKHVPEMASPVFAAAAGSTGGDPALSDAMRCGGCGAKVGANVLARVMERLRPKRAESVLVGLEGRDDAAVFAPPPGKLMVQTVDFFRAFIDDPYVFGRISATHALGDIYAMGATPMTALATAVVPYGAASKVEDDLYQMLRGGLDVLEAEGCALIGGHSAEGAELALGFTINGAVDADKVLRKSGMKAGDVLILTKPLGTGALFAADMRGKAKASWIASALRSMQQSNRVASDILRAHGATATTDVTGFGLAGHLYEMMLASKVDARLDLDALPALDGALDVLASAIESSLAPENRRLKDVIVGAADRARFSLLFDPQTAGGLLASVPAHRSISCLEHLQKTECCAAASIGLVEVQVGQAPTIRISPVEKP